MATRARPALADGQEWDRLETALARGATRGRGKPGPSKEVADLFDESELRDLRRLAEHAQLVRSRSPVLGNVIFLHGITGSDLAVVEKGDSDGVWVNIPRLILGRISDLKLGPDGKREANSSLEVQPTGLNKRYYAKAILLLRARWNVEPYAYDWRKDIDQASEGLATLIRQKFPNQPVHLVAHSLGGLVARNFIRQRPDIWEAMKDTELVAGGRLVMLGTPNYGSYAIPPVLTGSDQLIEMLERLDIRHDMTELLSITNTFLGSYMLLPAPDKLPAPLSSLYQRDTWGEIPGISQQHLNRTFQFYKDLESAATIDPSRMTYVAGCRQPTISSMSIVAPGEFEYGLTSLGDGRVPHALGLLPGVPTYYVDEVHGDLARNEQVLRAVDALLETGKTTELDTTVLRARDATEPKMRDYRSAADRLLLEELGRIAAKAQERGGPATLTADEQRIAEDALVKAALGASARSLPKALASAEAASDRARRAVSQVTPVDLEVAVSFGDVTGIKAPVVVVGHYRGVEPVNAIGAVDKALGGWIARAVKRGMISGQLGETFYIPSGGALAADGVVVAGMGDFGRFSPSALRQLMANVAVGAAALGLSSIASVLVGAGEGALEWDSALQQFLEGIGTGLTELREEQRQAEVSLKKLVLIERNPERFFALVGKLQRMANEGSLATVRLKVRKPVSGDEQRARSVAAKSHAAQVRRAVEAPTTRGLGFEEVRITVERDESKELFRFSALTRSAVVPVREVELNLRNAFEAAEALRNAQTRGEQERYGRLLYTYLLPEDFQALIDGPFPVRLIVDPTTASYPWEMACFQGRLDAAKLSWLGTDLGLSRQFKTLLSAAPGVSPPLNDRLRVLVVADPCPERELQLPGARAEGRRVVDLLKRANGQKIGGVKLDLQVEQRIGPGECDPVELLALLLSGDFDIVHYSGHGNYDANDPKLSGWIFGRDRVLTARDIFRARKVPRLVFANACFSGVLRESEPSPPQQTARSLASIAEAFLERGVPNYIGTGWPVDDQQAVKMAHVFYAGLLKGDESGQSLEIGQALQQARQQVFDEQIGATWGAYQLYGNPRDTLLRRREAAPQRG